MLGWLCCEESAVAHGGDNENGGSCHGANDDVDDENDTNGNMLQQDHLQLSSG